jgi:hypothetical protein
MLTKTEESSCATSLDRGATGVVELREGALALVFDSGAGYLVDARHDTVSQLPGRFVEWYLDKKRRQVILNDRGLYLTSIALDGSVAWRSATVARGGIPDVALIDWDSFSLGLT